MKIEGEFRMFIRKNWVGLLVLLIALVAVSIYLLQRVPPKAPITIEKPVEPMQTPEVKTPVDESSQAVDLHGDEPHAEPHDTPDVTNERVPAPPPVPVSRDYTPATVDIPDGITEPEVLAAWQRVEYIANNIWEWGGVPNPETLALIAQLMPNPAGFSGATGHSDMEETFNLLGSLDTNDPRSIVVMATYYCGGIVGGRGPANILAEMGVPAVPYLIPYMLDMENRPNLRSRAIIVLGKIAERHRADLEGIVEHILIQRLEAILEQENSDYFEEKRARDALSRLK